MALQLRRFTHGRTWFRDSKQLPGWTLEWQMGVDASGETVISALKIIRTLSEELLRKGEPGTPLWSGAVWEMSGYRRIPDGGVTTRLLRKVRLGPPARAGKYAIATDRLKPSRQKKARRSRGAPSTITIAWWKRLDKRRTELLREDRRDYARVLAKEFGLKEGVMRTRISRGIVKGYIRGYLRPEIATRVQRKPK